MKFWYVHTATRGVKYFTEKIYRKILYRIVYHNLNITNMAMTGILMVYLTCLIRWKIIHVEMTQRNRSVYCFITINLLLSLYLRIYVNFKRKDLSHVLWVFVSEVAVTIAFVPEFASCLFGVPGSWKKKLNVASYHYYLRRRRRRRRMLIIFNINWTIYLPSWISHSPSCVSSIKPLVILMTMILGKCVSK